MSNVTMDVLITQYVSDMKLKELSANTIVGRQRDLVRFWRGLAPDGSALRLKQITPDKVKLYVATRQSQTQRYANHPIRRELAGPLSRQSIANEVRLLKTFGNWLEREGYSNPFEELRIPKAARTLIDALSNDEVTRLIESINPATTIGARAAAMIWLFLDSGMRVNELVTARIADLDLANRRLKVMGKGSKERFVRFGQKCAKVLTQYISLHRPDPVKDECVFLALDGLPLTTNAARRIIMRLREEAKLPRLHPHLFRHTFAVNYVMNGGDIMSLKELLGHESLEMVNRYLHFSQTQIGSRYESFSPMDKMEVTALRRFGNKRRRKTDD